MRPCAQTWRAASHTEDDVVGCDGQQLAEDRLDGRHGGGDEGHDLVGQEVGLVLVREDCGAGVCVRGTVSCVCVCVCVCIFAGCGWVCWRRRRCPLSHKP